MMATAQAVLVCGGAGYIGSHMCKRLAQSGCVPIAFDNLSTGHRWAVKWGPLIEGDLLDVDVLAAVFRDHHIDAVMHFAARSLVGESLQQPALYFRNNVTGTLNLLDAMREAGVDKLVFSSTAAVYGNPVYTPIDEDHPTKPINPYGWSKLLAERQIEEYCRAYGLRAFVLRYFNAAGADPECEIGEAHVPETHLIPNIIKAALDPGDGPLHIFGNDYDTPDGTCIRDYIHVQDLCEVHLRALDCLADHKDRYRVLNVGTRYGHSVNDILSVCRNLLDGRPEATYVARRPGDPAVLVAGSASSGPGALDWQPTRTIHDCVRDAIAWHRAQSQAQAAGGVK